jgi:hypothetical protein
VVIVKEHTLRILIAVFDMDIFGHVQKIVKYPSVCPRGTTWFQLDRVGEIC